MSFSDASKYIISVFEKNSDNTWLSRGEGFVFIKDNDYGSTLEINSKGDNNDLDNYVYLNCFITNNLKIEYKDSDDKTGNTVRFTYNTFNIGIKFDASSSSAFANFKTNLENKMKVKKEIAYYPSGNPNIIGDSIDGKLTGKGTAFYDNINKQIKYIGEFEDGQCDGEGIFYSDDNIISIENKNISNGKLIGICKLTIKRVKDKDLIKHFDIKDLKIFYNIYEDNFCNKIAKYYLPGINEILFEDKSSDDKIKILIKRLDEMDNRFNAYIKKQNERNIFSIIMKFFKY